MPNYFARYSIVCLPLIFISQLLFGQFSTEDTLGFRLKKSPTDFFIFADKEGNVNFSDSRRLNHSVYFRVTNTPKITLSGVSYQQIVIPGPAPDKKDRQPQDTDGVISYPRDGKPVNKDDYQQLFWININYIKTKTNPEFYKYSRDFFSGLLTAPFKYRLGQGNSLGSIIDGDFNVAPFLGMKFRISSVRPHYFAIFGFAGFTTLSYSSANNSGIDNLSRVESGNGCTYGGGFAFRLGDVSPGLIIGWDHGAGELSKTFKYQDKPWISFSLNYDFFKPKQTSESQ